ncbi:MAG: hypothetical protein JXA18_08985 [Chitinispirillaceae bacterium]|nr:hypothetical protein [Chitinispirillaceae bacterium]
MPGKSILPGCCFIAVSVLLYCSGGSGDLAGGVETTNGINVIASAGEIRGITVPDTRIIVSDTAHAPLKVSTKTFADTVYAGNDGKFVFTDVPTGVYNLLAQKSDFGGGCIIRDIEVDSSSTGPWRDSSRFVPLVELAVVTKIDTVPQHNSIVFIRGTAIMDTTGADGSCTLAGIPAGFYSIEAVFQERREVDPVVYTARTDSVLAGPADTAATVILDLKPLP